MEPIGQKTALTSSEEIFTTDLEVESGETETEKIFDSTLDQMLAEETDYENILEELLEKDSQNSLISYVHQNQYDSEIRAEETSDRLTDHAMFPTEKMRHDVFSEDSRHVQSNFLKKSVPIAEQMIELSDPRIATEESNFVYLEESGIAETGLQSLLDESKIDSSNAVLQKFLHQVEHVSDDTELSEDVMQTVLKQNSGNAFSSEEAVDIPRSSLYTIMHKTSNQTALSEESVLPEETVLQTGNEIKSASHKTINQAVLPEEPVLPLESLLPEEAILQIGNEFKSASHKTVNQAVLPEEQVLPLEYLLPEEAILQTGNEFKSASHKTVNQAVLPEEPVLPLEYLLPEEAVLQRGNEIKSASHKTINQAVLPEETVVQTGNEIKSELGNNLVREIQNNKEILSSNRKTAEETQSFNHKHAMSPVSSHLVSENSQNAEISSDDPTKNILAGNSMSKEHLKESESLQVVENIKANERSQTKASIKDLEEFAVEAKSKVSDGLRITEKDKSVPESQSLTRPKVSDVSKLTERFKVTDDLQGHAKGKGSEDWLAKEIFKSPDELKETVKAKEIFQTTGNETSKVSSEKLSVSPINQFRTAASIETKLSGNSNSGIETVMSTGISASSETSGTSIYKTPDSINSSADSLRNVDLPFDVQQLVSRVKIIRGNGVEEMTLRLHPEELGNITLKVRQSGGDLLIDMRVDNSLAKQLVESGFDSLRSRFLDQEFAYKDLALNVDINQKDSQFGSDRQHEEFEDELFSSQRGKEQEISSLEEKPLERHRTDSGLNLYV